MKHYFEGVLVILGVWDIILGEWGSMGHYFGWLEVSGALFWVGGSGWVNILGAWG